MKKSIATIGSFILMISMYSQNKTFEPKPKGMEFVPQGSFQMKTIVNSESKVFNVSVDAFWMSNEITNGEYKEFVDWARNNPDKKIYQVNYVPEVFSDTKKGIMKDTMVIKVIPIEVSKFNADMIDLSCLGKVNKDYKDYFTDKKYNDYPVVGVSFRMAEYFCLWKTMLENEQLKEKGLPNIQSYRIPLEAEWEYVAQQSSDNNSVKNDKLVIKKVSEGNTNKWGLSHLDDNVSEWVTPSKEKNGIVRGGSWKTGANILEREVKDPNSKEGNIGFRIMRSYITTYPYEKTNNQ